MKLNKFNYSDSRYRTDPWTSFAELREQGPVIRFKMPFLGKGWAATTYESVTEVFRNDTLFVRSLANAGRRSFGWIEWFLPRSIQILKKNLLSTDGKVHRRLRSLVDKAFNRRNIDGMSDRIETLANEQLDVAVANVDADGTVDLLEHYARPFPLMVICELLGIPMEDYGKFSKWFEPISNFKGFFDIFRMGFGVRNMNRYLRKQFELVRNAPREGLMSELVSVHDEGEALSEDELLAMVMILFMAGHETTVHLISNCLLTFSQLPEARKELESNWDQCDAAVDEVLRYCSPIQMGKPRFVAQDTDFFGQQLKRGEMIVPLIASANYDPERFDSPQEFKLDRPQNYHLSFGSGPHTCLGMKLARSETYHALRTLYERFPKIAPSFTPENTDWNKRPGVRGVGSFRVRLKP